MISSVNSLILKARGRNGSKARGGSVTSFEECCKIVQVEADGCLRGRSSAPLKAQSALMGDGGMFDSILLIELCIRLEDRSSELGFEFDWTSDAAMSRSRSMFATVESLAQEFYDQLLASK